jgi:hypothetical protein
MFNDGQEKRKLVAYLCHRLDLPIYRSAIDFQSEKPAGISTVWQLKKDGFIAKEYLHRIG